MFTVVLCFANNGKPHFFSFFYTWSHKDLPKSCQQDDEEQEEGPLRFNSTSATAWEKSAQYLGFLVCHFLDLLETWWELTTEVDDL